MNQCSVNSTTCKTDCFVFAEPVTSLISSKRLSRELPKISLFSVKACRLRYFGVLGIGGGGEHKLKFGFSVP